MKLYLDWYIDARLARSTPLNSNEREGLPLLAYALKLHLWDLEGAVKPDACMVTLLLKHGANPNSKFDGFTIWQHVIRYIHIVSIPQRTMENMIAWLQVFRFMLYYGADPYACCIQDPNLWCHPIKPGAKINSCCNSVVVAGHAPLGSCFERRHSIKEVVSDLACGRSHPHTAKTFRVFEENMKSYIGRRRKRVQNHRKGDQS